MLAPGLDRRRRPPAAGGRPGPRAATSAAPARDPGPRPLGRRAIRDRPALRLVGEAEHSLAEDVALHLAGAAPDGQGGGEQVARGATGPPRRAERPWSVSIPAAPVGSLPRLNTLAVLVGQHLLDRRLGPRRRAPDGGAHGAEPDEPQDLAPRCAGRRAAAAARVVRAPRRARGRLSSAPVGPRPHKHRRDSDTRSLARVTLARLQPSPSSRPGCRRAGGPRRGRPR